MGRSREGVAQGKLSPKESFGRDFPKLSENIPEIHRGQAGAFALS
jgi:hypothetical protein